MTLRKWLMGLVYAVLAAVIAVAAAIASPASGFMAQHRSWGYHVSPDGSPSTPAAPPVVQDSDRDGIVDGSIQTVDFLIEGRANIHSGGRLHGSANKRVGCGGCGGHPADWDFRHPGVTVPLMTDGFGRNRGTRPHHPRATCRCN